MFFFIVISEYKKWRYYYAKKLLTFLLVGAISFGGAFASTTVESHAFGGYVSAKYLQADKGCNHWEDEKTGDDYCARVKLRNSNSSLNVRNKPYTSGRIVRTLKDGCLVLVHSVQDGWAYIFR